MSEESELEGWHRFIGSWETEGAHPILPGDTISGRGELSKDGSTWEDDLALDYRRLT